MSQNVFEREVTQVDLANGNAEIDLPRSHYFQRLALTLDWDITVDAIDASQNRSGILEAIQDIQATLNGNQTVKRMDLEMSHYIDQYQYGTEPLVDRIDYGTASQQTGTVQTFVDFLVVPGDLSAMLPAFETSDFTLSLDAPSVSDIDSTGANITINALDVTVTSQERLRKSVASNRQKEKQILSNLMIFKERQKRKTLDSTGETPIDLPRGNVYYATPFRVYDNGAPDNDLVERFSVEEDGVETHKDVAYGAARARDQVEYGFQSSELPDGFVYPNFGLKGNLDDVVASSGMDSWELTVDTDGTPPTDPAEVELVTQELIR